MEYLKQVYKAAWAQLNHQIPEYVPSAVNAAFQPDLFKCLRFHEAMLIGEVIPEIFRYLSANRGPPERAEFYHIPVDEYQDLYKAEQPIIELLSGAAEVCIVDD